MHRNHGVIQLNAMKRRTLLCLLLLLSLAGSTGGVWAQERWRDLPPDERRQMRQQMREHWQQERELRREDGHRRWGDVPPEDRRRMREEIREQRGWLQERGGREGRGGRRD
ncbi:MAG: hypothetical protein H6R15_392 [Proteobacteria bacterium]|nr:hypothetical protein [Pseudomonadota bacterium]